MSILGPIYLYQAGFSIQAILLFFIVTALVKVGSLFIVFNLAGRHGPQLTMLLGVCLMMVYFVCFGLIEAAGWSIYIAAAMLGLANAFFYPSFRMNFSLQVRRTQINAQVARLNIITIIFSAIAPAIGGLLATLVSIQAPYYLAALIFLIVFMTLLRGSEARPHPSFTMNRIPKGPAMRDYIANSSYSFSGLADLAVWPLLIGLIIPTYAGIGAYVGVMVILAVAVQYGVAHYGKRYGERDVLYAGVVLNSVYNTLRIFASTTGQLIGLGLVDAASGSLLSGAYGSRFYKNIDKKRRFEYLFGMEFANSITWLLYFPVLLVASYVLSFEATIRFGVICVIPAVVGMLLIRLRATRPGRFLRQVEQ